MPFYINLLCHCDLQHGCMIVEDVCTILQGNAFCNGESEGWLTIHDLHQAILQRSRCRSFISQLLLVACKGKTFRIRFDIYQQVDG